MYSPGTTFGLGSTGPRLHAPSRIASAIPSVVARTATRARRVAAADIFASKSNRRWANVLVARGTGSFWPNPADSVASHPMAEAQSRLRVYERPSATRFPSHGTATFLATLANASNTRGQTARIAVPLSRRSKTERGATVA